MCNLTNPPSFCWAIDDVMLLAGLAGSIETATSAKAIALQARDQMLSTQMLYFDLLFVDHRTTCLFKVEGFGSFSDFLS